MADLIDLPAHVVPSNLNKYVNESIVREVNNPEKIDPDPNDNILDFGGKPVPWAAPCGFFSASPAEWRKVLRRTARAGCLSLGDPKDSDPRLAAGAFCVDKIVL